MTRALLPLALCIVAGLAVLADVRASPLDVDACAKLKVEREGLEQAGVRGNMVKGPQWAKANLAPDKLEQIKRLIDLEGQLLFRCSGQRLVELPAGVEADPAAATPADNSAEGKQDAPAQSPKENTAPGGEKKAAADKKAPAAKAPPAKAEDKAKQEDAAKTKAPAQKTAPAKRPPEKTGQDGSEPAAKAAAAKAKPKAKAKADDAYKAPPPADPNANPFPKLPQ